MQIQCTGSAWALVSSPPTAECVLLSLSCLCLQDVHVCDRQRGHSCFFLTRCDQSTTCVRLCVRHTAFWKFKPSRSGTQARLTLWPTCGLERESLPLLWVYQHNAAQGDKWRQLLKYRMRSFGGPGLSTFLWGLFIPFVAYCAVMATGTQQQLSSHTVENQWLHYVGCFGQRPVRRSQAIMYYSCGTIKI